MSDFWSRRKAAVEAESRAEAEAAAAAERAAREARAAEKTDEELLRELSLPEPDSLGEGDDFRPFLAEAVPARIKTRALRRLWRVNPVLANLDGLVEYGEDFTDGATVIESLQTAYQVGRGMLAHLEDIARQAEQGQAETAPARAGEAPVLASEAPAALAAAEEIEDEDPAAAREQDSPDEAEIVAEAEIVPGRRRMRFVFQDQDQRTG